ncbi:carboxylesterase/lipase family protein [Novosphingobium decolorationis]|uniref:Carboxylic ester hydrolase n=1 Tax=Novosphingobium decolorationis TaxID=2698673 RepID=A0ABX8E6N6_9SPHN|nr:carboxylesterase family protein [Novosphingobium decolorationis]QVM84637.1 carboxylesterase/lipase family protein [Novosphingobium decolorationis]
MPSRRDALSAGLLLSGGLALAPSAGAAAAPSGVRTGTPAGQDTASTLTTPAGLVVETTGGRVRGYESRGIATFKGIPYGADTGGEGRFLPPRKVDPWPGTRLCLVPGAICPQAGEGPSASPMAFLNPGTPSVQSEDCLNLNVWTPGTGLGTGTGTGKRPVMVWIHGGNYSTGSSLAIRATDGEALARRGDVVVVSVNHRLNALGYLDLGALGSDSDFAASGNAGMLDLVLALEWVRDNIAQFGGDADNVTIFGQSGGGLKVTTLCAMPAARGLFHKAIAQSGSIRQLFGREMTEPLALGLLSQLDVPASDLRQLQSLPLAQVQAAAQAAQGQWFAKAKPGEIWHLVGWAPVRDGTIIPADPYSVQGRALSADIPLMVGTVRHEFCLTMFTLEAEKRSWADLREGIGAAFRDPDPLIAAYRAAHPEEKPVGLQAMMSADSFNRHNALEQARGQTAAGRAPAFLYRFDWITPQFDGAPRAYHCSELPLVFDSLDIVPEAAGTGPRAKAMAANAADAWIAFARTGNPSHAGIGTWTPLSSPQDAATMVFDDTCRMERQNTDLIARMRDHALWL